LIKWWAQSYLVGIPKIVCGYRDDNGIVHRLETFNTLGIPNMVQVGTFNINLEYCDPIVLLDRSPNETIFG